jgi:hypothetical protein
MANPIDQRSGNGNLMLQGNQFIRSDLPANPADDDGDDGVKYGQNGYSGASSDLPGKRTTSGFLPEQAAKKEALSDNWQTRKVSAEPYATHPGMRNRSGEGGTIPTTNMRRPTKSGR